MPDKIKIPELNIEVKDVDEFNDKAEEILTGFCEGLEKEGQTRPPEEDESSFLFMWTNKAMKLIDTEIGRLCDIGMMYFDQLDINISSHMYNEI